MPLYTRLHILLNVLLQIANKVGLQKKNLPCLSLWSRGNTPNALDSENPVLRGSGPCWLSPISPLHSTLLHNGLTTAAIPTQSLLDDDDGLQTV
jgi:hypothetical protein